MLRLVILLLQVAEVAASAVPAEAVRRPNVLFIAFDDLGDWIQPLDPTAPRERPALMTEMRGNHAVRTDRWPYIRSADGTEELYDHASDPHEWSNLAALPGVAPILAEPRRWLPVNEAASASNCQPQVSP